MPHFREQIRTEIVSALAGVTAVSGRIYAGSPPVNLDDALLPAIYVTTPETTIESVTMRPASGALTLYRTTDVDVAIVVRGAAGSTVEDQIDELCIEVEGFIHTNRVGSLKGWALVSESTTVDNQTGEQILAEHVLTYQADYATPEGAPIFYT